MRQGRGVASMEGLLPSGADGTSRRRSQLVRHWERAAGSPTITSRGGLRTSGLQLGILAVRGFNCTMAHASKKNKRICHWLSIRQPDQKTAQPRVVEHRVLRTLAARFHTPPFAFATLKNWMGEMDERKRRQDEDYSTSQCSVLSAMLRRRWSVCGVDVDVDGRDRRYRHRGDVDGRRRPSSVPGHRASTRPAPPPPSGRHASDRQAARATVLLVCAPLRPHLLACLRPGGTLPVQPYRLISTFEAPELEVRGREDERTECDPPTRVAGTRARGIAPEGTARRPSGTEPTYSEGRFHASLHLWLCSPAPPRTLVFAKGERRLGGQARSYGTLLR